MIKLVKEETGKNLGTGNEEKKDEIRASRLWPRPRERSVRNKRTPLDANSRIVERPERVVIEKNYKRGRLKNNKCRKGLRALIVSVGLS